MSRINEIRPAWDGVTDLQFALHAAVDARKWDTPEAEASALAKALGTARDLATAVGLIADTITARQAALSGGPK